MKKPILLALCTALAVGASAKTWTNNIGVGVAVPFSITGVDDDNVDDVTQLEFGVGGTYIGYHESGFTVKADLAIGVGITDDISVQSNKRNVGVFENAAAGVGYSFLRTERFLLGAAAMFGMELSQYDDDDDARVAGVKHTYTTSQLLVTLSVGGDVFTRYRLGEHVGLFANVGARYLVWGSSTLQTKDEWTTDDDVKHSRTNDDATDLWGKFIVQPTLGIIWTF